MFWHFINTTAYHLGRYEPSSPISCRTHCLRFRRKQIRSCWLKVPLRTASLVQNSIKTLSGKHAMLPKLRSCHGSSVNNLSDYFERFFLQTFNFKVKISSLVLESLNTKAFILLLWPLFGVLDLWRWPFLLTFLHICVKWCRLKFINERQRQFSIKWYIMICRSFQARPFGNYFCWSLSIKMCQSSLKNIY